MAKLLEASDRWQYDLWKLVHASIGQDPWAAVVQKYIEKPELFVNNSLPPRLLIVGVQSLSVRHIRMLQLLGQHTDVEVLIVHPSAALAQQWSTAPFENVPSQIIAPLAPKRVEFDESVDPLVGMWLRGAHEAQQLLASQAVTPVLHSVQPVSSPENLLSALQESVRTGVAVKTDFNNTDQSVQMHRAHNLSRQIEILHDALIHSFNQVDQLEPHDVVIVCADIEAAAPLLEATFGRRVKSKNGNYVLPVVVADRGLRFVDDGASLLSNILTAVRGRFSIADVMSVATSSLVLQNFGATSDDVEAWNRIIERTRIRWGANQQHRARMNVDVVEDAHTWSAGLGRALVGAMLPDAPMQQDFGNVVPLANIEAIDIQTVATLSRIVAALVDLEIKTNNSAHLTIVEWADAVEATLVALGVDTRGQLDGAREVINKLRGYVSMAGGAGVASTVCTFDHFADLLDELIAGTPGRQPLRTGAITATSMVPLRSVPFKVVCLVGFDEGTMRTGEAEGDDLVSRQDFVGDSNARIDQRRAILDAFVAAEQQLIITCNGRSIKDNTEVPLITPLSEFLDLCERCGVEKSDSEGNHLVIEYQHPRHFGSVRNYVEGAIVPGIVWSHDEVGLAALSDKALKTKKRIEAEELSEKLDNSSALAGESEVSNYQVVSVDELRYFIVNPLRPFVRDTLGIRTWKDEETEEPAEIPLAPEKWQQRDLCKSLVSAQLNGTSLQDWAKVQQQIGALPFGVFGSGLIEEVQLRVSEANKQAAAWGIDFTTAITERISLSLADIELSGTVRYCNAADGRITVYEYDSEQDGNFKKERLALDLLLLMASGKPNAAEGLLVCLDDVTKTHLVVLDPDFTQASAQQKLEEIVKLFQLALVSPNPLFDKTAKLVGAGEEADARKAFTSVGPRTLKADEKLIYGSLSKFDDVFTPDVYNFFAEYFEAILVQDDVREKSLRPLDAKGKPGKARVEAPNDTNYDSKKYLFR